MNKTELIQKVAATTGVKKSDVEKALNATMDAIKEANKKGETVQLIGFGSFSVGSRKARTGKNPLTGEKIKIAACKYPKFRPGQAFKDAVNKKKVAKPEVKKAVVKKATKKK